MGLIANYQEINTEDLDRIVETIESEVEINLYRELDNLANNESLNQYNMDKMWDSLNFLITEETHEDLSFKSLVTDAIFGSCQFPDDMVDIYLAFVAPDGVCNVADALNDIDIDEYLDEFDMKKFAKHEVYPNIWEHEDEKELIKADLKTCFEDLKEFYTETAKNGNCALVFIG